MTRYLVFVSLAASLAACTHGGPGDVTLDLGAPDGPVAPPPLDPDFGPEGMVPCPSPHFCLEYPSATWQPMAAIAATPAGGLYAVGSGGAVLHSHSGGAQWATVPVPTTANLTAVAVAPSTVLIAGENGTLLRLVDGKFVSDTVDASASFTALHVAADHDAWVVGNEGGRGVALHWDGMSWSHVADAALPQLYAVGGSSPTDIWIGGGALQSIALYHLAGGAWTAAPDPAVTTQAEGPIRALLVDAPTAVHVATDGINFRDLMLFDGASWSDEDHKPIASPSDVAHALARAPDGVIWAASDPPYVRAGSQWSPASGTPIVSVSVNGVAWSGGTVIVAGDHGLLGPYSSALGPISGVMSGKAFSGGNVVLSSRGLYLESASHQFTRLAADEWMHWLGANSLTDIAALAIYPGADPSDPYSYLMAYRSTGGSATNAAMEMPLPGDFAQGLAYDAQGNLFWAQSSNQLFGKLAKGATAWSQVKCNGATLAGARQLWTDGTDSLLRTDTGTQVKLYHLTATACTALTANFFWPDEHAIGGTGYSDLWVLDGSTAALGHWDGTKWTSAMTTPAVYCSLLYFGAGDLWLAGCGTANGGTAALAHWDGSNFTTYEVGVPIGFLSLWGYDATHVWVGDESGRIFRFVP